MLSSCLFRCIALHDSLVLTYYWGITQCIFCISSHHYSHVYWHLPLGITRRLRFKQTGTAQVLPIPPLKFCPRASYFLPVCLKFLFLLLEVHKGNFHVQHYCRRLLKLDIKNGVKWHMKQAVPLLLPGATHGHLY